MVAIDTFFIRNTEYHYLFNALFYGYDLEQREIKVMSYDGAFFKSVQIPFEKIISSYTFTKQESNRTNREKFALRNLKLKNVNPVFVPVKFIKDVEKFLNSDGTNQEVGLRPWDDYIKSYGITSFYDLGSYINDVIGSIGTEVRLYYHDIHIFSEHKRLLLERFSYINTLVDIPECIERYVSISQQAEHLRLKYIKKQLKEGSSIYAQISDIEFLKYLQREVYDITFLEEKMLHEILRILYQRI